MRYAMAGAVLAGLIWHPALGVLAAVVAYVAACAWYPLTNCWCCSGSGRHRSRSGRTFRRCWTCSGRGSWLRVGRRLADSLFSGEDE